MIRHIISHREKENFVLVGLYSISVVSKPYQVTLDFIFIYISAQCVLGAEDYFNVAANFERDRYGIVPIKHISKAIEPCQAPGQGH